LLGDVYDHERDRGMDLTAVRGEATDLLRDLIRIDTSNPPGRETPAAVFLRDYLEGAGISCELVARDPERANLIARIPGTGEGPSLLLMGHTDVVPADAADWAHPPFGGHVDAAGYVWGRGAADMKNETATRALAMALLARSGFRPRGDVVFLAQADEEDGEHEVGLTWLRHQRPDLRCDYALDEGGGYRLPLADGRTAVTLNVGEKASLWARVTALGEAGHASKPTIGANAVLRLATLIDRLGKHRPPTILLPETRRMLELLVGPFGEDADAAIERAVRLSPLFADDLPPLFHTTIAPTRLEGSDALNVMPGRATAICDCRLLPGSTRDDLERELRLALGRDVPYELELAAEPVGGSASPLDTPLHEICRRFVEEHEPGALLLPTISTGFCDAHFVRESFGTVAYGFWPAFRTPPDVYMNGVHNKDERIMADDLVLGTIFHVEAARAISERPR
jgi:acetylornithine deacetylase/succinyl-diaminopimelate desuccinylase-like protein